MTYHPLKLTTDQKQAAKFIQELKKACWQSEKFKRKLIKSPVKTIEKLTGRKNRLPKGIKIQVEDQSDPSIIYLNIPANPNLK